MAGHGVGMEAIAPRSKGGAYLVSSGGWLLVVVVLLLPVSFS